MTAAAPGAAPVASAKPKAAESWIRDNLEAVAVAIIMALLIRHFCVEAFRIPTSSMEPTLYGQAADRSGDRILVNKVGYFFGEPQRWHVVVFKYPLNRSRNYIKRLIGLPGESIDIRGGDIWVDGKLARKPDAVQADLWREVFALDRAVKDGLDEVDYERRRGALPGNGGDDEPADPGRALLRAIGFRDPEQIGQVVDGTLRLDARGRSGAAWVVMPEKGPDGLYVAHTEGRMLDVADVRLRCTLTATPGQAGAVWLRLGPGDGRFRVRLPVGGGAATVWQATPGAPSEALGTKLALAPAVDLPAGTPVRIEAAHVDGTLRVSIDGREVIRHEYEPAAPPMDDATWDGLPALGVEDAAVEVTTLDLGRDLHYRRGDHPERLPFQVPAGHYLMLGDNSGSSKDSRMWISVEFDLADGTTIRGDGDTGATGDDGRRQYVLDPDAGTLELVDDSGRLWQLRRDEVTNFHSPRVAVAPFVPRENVVGRAFFIFFPLKRISFIR